MASSYEKKRSQRMGTQRIPLFVLAIVFEQELNALKLAQTRSARYFVVQSVFGLKFFQTSTAANVFFLNLMKIKMAEELILVTTLMETSIPEGSIMLFFRSQLMRLAVGRRDSRRQEKSRPS